MSLKGGEEENNENTQLGNNTSEGVAIGIENNKNEGIHSEKNEPDTDLIDLSDDNNDNNNEHSDPTRAPDEDIDMVSLERRDVPSKVAKISPGQLENALEMGRQRCH